MEAACDTSGTPDFSVTSRRSSGGRSMICVSRYGELPVHTAPRTTGRVSAWRNSADGKRAPPPGRGHAKFLVTRRPAAAAPAAAQLWDLFCYYLFAVAASWLSCIHPFLPLLQPSRPATSAAYGVAGTAATPAQQHPRLSKQQLQHAPGVAAAVPMPAADAGPMCHVATRCSGQESDTRLAPSLWCF